MGTCGWNLKFFFNLINKTNSKRMVTIKFHGFVI